MNGIFSILLGLTGGLLLSQIVNLFTMRRGDGFSRSMAYSLGGLCTCVMWGLIAVLLGLARMKSMFPSFSGWAMLVLLPLGVVAMLRVNHFMRSYEHSRWLILWGVLPAVLSLALSVVVRFGQSLPWLELDGINAWVWSVTVTLAAIPLFTERKARRLNQSSPETS